jgi:probable F420-dependent oxidoreductase
MRQACQTGNRGAHGAVVSFGWLSFCPVTDTKQRPIRIGVQIAQQHGDYKNIRRAAAEAEDIGVDIIFNWDHFFPLSGETYGKHFECWTMLGAWAEQTSRVQLGALVTCNSYRNPELLADMARTVDHISDGRLILGIGSGWKELDYTEYGYEFGTPGSRLDDLAEAMPRIEARFAKLNPPPTRKIPVLIGGGGEKKTLRLVAKHADMWHSFARGADFDRKKQVLAAHCADVGRDPGEIELSVGAGGDPEVNGPALLAQGITTFTIGVRGPDFDLSTARAWVDWRNKSTFD